MDATFPVWLVLVIILALPVIGVGVLLWSASQRREDQRRTGRSPEAGDMWTHWDEYQ